VENLGVFNGATGAEAFGFRNLKRVYWNLGAPGLYEQALQRGEGQLIEGGAFNADTGIHTGRSPKDKFVVRDENTENEVWWDNNAAITRENSTCCSRIFWPMPRAASFSPRISMAAPIRPSGSRPASTPSSPGTRCFIRNLLIRPEPGDLPGYVPDMTIIDLPSFRADPNATAFDPKRSSPWI
jgi:phosphoenolpyruvate carboxykinase (ATP)